MPTMAPPKSTCQYPPTADGLQRSRFQMYTIQASPLSRETPTGMFGLLSIANTLPESGGVIHIRVQRVQCRSLSSRGKPIELAGPLPNQLLRPGGQFFGR